MGMLPPRSELQSNLEYELAKWDKTFKSRIFENEEELLEAVKRNHRFVEKVDNSTMEEFKHTSLLAPEIKIYVATFKDYPKKQYNIAYECLSEGKIIGGAPKISIRENTQPMQLYKGLKFNCSHCPTILYNWTKELS